MRFHFRGLTTAMVTMAMLGTITASRTDAAEEVLNLYTSRHYQTDEALYEGFTTATGIKINRIEGKEDALIERIKSEGANSPADVLITVDAGRLWRAEQGSASSCRWAIWASKFRGTASPLPALISPPTVTS